MAGNPIASILTGQDSGDGNIGTNTRVESSIKDPAVDVFVQSSLPRACTKAKGEGIESKINLGMCGIGAQGAHGEE